MKGILLGFLAATVSLFATSYATDQTIQDNATGIVFPSQVTFDHQGKTYKLDATGVATRKVFFVKVYSIASYLQSNAHKPNGDVLQEIMQDENAKQLTQKWVHDADQSRFHAGYIESFKKTLPEQQFNALQNDISQFLSFFKQEVKAGDEHILRWIPEGYVEVLVNGNKVGSISSKDFAEALWSIWFGDHSVVDKTHLVSLVH